MLVEYCVLVPRLQLGRKVFKQGSLVYFDAFYNGSGQDFRLWESGMKSPADPRWQWFTTGYVARLVSDKKLSRTLIDEPEYDYNPPA